jgi:hypothetical protein
MPPSGFEHAPWHSDFISWVYRGLGGPNVGRLSEDKLRKEVMPVISRALIKALESETVAEDADGFGGYFDGLVELRDGELTFVPWDKIIDLVEEAGDFPDEEGPDEEEVHAYIDEQVKADPEHCYGGYVLVSQDEGLEGDGG